VPFRETGANTLPQEFPNHGIDFADVDMDGEHKEHFFLVQEKVGTGTRVINVSYKLSVRNEKGVLISALTKEAEPLPVGLRFPPERQLYVTKPFTGAATLEDDVLVITDAA